MKPISVERMRAATRGLVVCGSREAEVTGIGTDSRTIRRGDLFVALCGENFDGHDYIRRALEAGACGAIYSRDFKIYPDDAQRIFIKVADTLEALGEVARAYRRELRSSVVGITGSNGKTTTKEMARHLLAEKLDVVASPASFNNLVGVPLTLFGADAATRVVVLEMGANHPGEIARLAEIAQPDMGVITNVGRTHLEGFSSIEGVARAKAELFHALPAGGCAILNADDKNLEKLRSLSDAKVRTFGIDNPADVFADAIERDERGFRFRLNGAVEARLSVPGRHNIYNALAAVAVCRMLGLDLEYLAGRLESFRLPSMRLEERSCRGVTLVNDAYNANPESVAAAIEELAGRKCKRSFLLFADMLELGDQSARLHFEVGRHAARMGIDFFWATGEMARFAIDGARDAGMSGRRARVFPTAAELAKALQATLSKGDVALLKASRGMKLEQVMDVLC